MKAGFHVAGLKELGESLEDFKRSTGRNIARRALRKSLQPIADHAKDLVREKTGALKESIKVSDKLTRRQQAQHQPRNGAVHMFVGAGGLTQAVTEEYGTENQAPHPYMRPAWDAHKDQILETIKDDLKTEIDKAAERARRRAERAKKRAQAQAARGR